MALILVTPLVRNRKNYTSACLLNTDHVIDFRKDASYPTTKTTLYYAYDGKKWEFTLSHDRNTVATRMYEYEGNPVRQLHVVSKKEQMGFEKPVDEIWSVNVKAILFAENISTTQSYVYLQTGASVIRLKTSHLVSDLSRVYSTSASLSAS